MVKWMDVMDCSLSKLWKSDTKMIWGGPIFSVSCDGDEVVMMISSLAMWNSPRLIPDANATALDPLDIHNSTLLRT